MQRNPETGLPMVDLDNQAIADEIIVLVKERDALKAENARLFKLLRKHQRDICRMNCTEDEVGERVHGKACQLVRAALTGRDSE